jgi:hypothetical protein
MQYGMMITPGERLTIIYDNTSIDEPYQVTSLSRLVEFLGNKDVYPQGVSRPSLNLLRQIKNLPVSELDDRNSIPFQIDNLGLGSLFNIASPNFIKQVPSSVHRYFQSTSCYLANSKVGTVTTIPGGDAHAGFGSSKDIVRVLLFWTGSPLGVDGYDGDSQDTKVTAMIDLAKRLWDELILAETKQILHLVCLCLMMSYPQYKNFVIGIMQNVLWCLSFLWK